MQAVRRMMTRLNSAGTYSSLSKRQTLAIDAMRGYWASISRQSECANTGIYGMRLKKNIDYMTCL